MILRFVVLVILLIASVVAPPTQKRRTVLVIGDSLGVGMGPTLQKLGRADGDTVIVEAVVGTTTCQWATRVESSVKRNKPTTVLISLGTNDTPNTRSWLTAHVGCYSGVAKEIRATGADVMWILPPTLPARLEDNRKWVSVEARKVSDRSFDSTTLTLPRAPDGIHFAPQGYEAWAKQVWAWSK